MKQLNLKLIQNLNLPVSDSNGNKTLQGMGVPIKITDYYTNLIEVQNTVPEYLKFLESFGISRYEGYGTITGWRQFRCTRGHLYSYPEARVNKYNPYYLWTSVRAAASRTMRKLEGLPELRNIYDLVLTYPKEVSDLAITDMDIELKCHNCFKEFVKRLSYLVYHYRVGKKLIPCKLALSENLHIWKSEEPLRPHLHHHVMLLDIYLGKDKKKGRIYSMRFMDWDKKAKKWVNGKLLEAIKSTWADCVNKNFGTSYRILDVHNDIRSVDRDRKRILHKLKYKKRIPLFDLAEYYRTHEFKAVGLLPGYLEKLISYRNKTHIFGFWNRLLCSIVSRDLKKYECRCPFCGEKSKDLGVRPLEPNAKEIYIDRHGRFWNMDS